MQPTSSLLLTKNPSEMYFTVFSKFTEKRQRGKDIVNQILFLFPFSLIEDTELRRRFLLSADANPLFVKTALLPPKKQIEIHCQYYPDFVPYAALPERKKGEIVIKGVSKIVFQKRFQTTPTRFFDKYMSDFKALFSQAGSSITHTATSTDLSSTRVKQVGRPELGTTTYLTPLQHLSENVPFTDLITHSHKFTREIEAFFRLIIKQVPHQSITISPYDSLWLAFDILIENEIAISHFSLEEREFLSKSTHNHLAKLYSHFSIMMSCIKNHPSREMGPSILKMLEKCQGIVLELQNLPNSFPSSSTGSSSAVEAAFPSSPSEKKYCKIGPSLECLINILIDGSQIRDPLQYDATYLSYAINRIFEYFQNPLNKLYEHLKITATITPEGLKNILIVRANMLKDQLTRSSQELSGEMQTYLISWSVKAEHLSLLVQEEEWTDAWSLIDECLADFQKKFTENPQKATPFISIENQIMLRPYLLVKSIYDNFIHFVRSDKISMLIVDATEDIRIAHEQLRQFSSTPHIDPELQPWIKEVKQTASKEFKTALRDFNLKLAKLEEMRENLSQSGRLREIFTASPLETEEKELWISKELGDEIELFFEDWITHLHDINKLVPHLQNTFLSHLFNPTISVPDLDLLRKKFKQFNSRLKSIVEPSANLLAAYEKLKQFKFLTYSSSSSSSSSGVDRLIVDSKKLGQIKLKLFATDSETFAPFRENLEAFQRELDRLSTISPIALTQEQDKPLIETEPLAGSSTNLLGSSEEPIEAISNAFKKHTKSEKILRHLNKVFRQLGIIDHVRVIPGKGSHFHVEIGSARITFPRASFWKPGLKAQLMRDSIEAVKKAIPATSEERAPISSSGAASSSSSSSTQ